jgi:hypothetical protein
MNLDKFRRKKNVFAFKGYTCRFKSEAFASFASIALRPCDINFGSDKVIQWVPVGHKVLTNGQERLFRKVTSVSIHSFVEWLDTFSYVLQPADVTVKEVNHIRRFAIDIAKDLILLSCRLAMEHLCMLQLEKALATLVTTWFILADRRWRSRYRSSDQSILHAFRSPERYNGWFREQLGQRFTFLNIYIYIYYEFSLLHIFSLVLQSWMSAYIRKTDGVYISVPKNDINMDDKTLRFTESMV